MFFSAVAEKNSSPEFLVEGTGRSVAFFQNKKEWMTWPEFGRFMQNAGKLWSEQELIALGGQFFRSPLIRSVLLPARLLFGPRDIYHWVYTDPKGLGQQMFPCVQNRYTELGEDHAQLELWLPDGYAYSPEFFFVSQGTLTDLSRILGFGPARVSRTSTARGVLFDIRVQLQGRNLARLLGAVRARINAGGIARELKTANEELADRYRELQEAKAALDDLNKNLERKVEERTAELEETIRQLEEAQRTRDQFFANINHELRTPLSLVLLSVDDLEKRLGSAVDAAAHARIGAIQSSARRLLRLVDALLLLAARQEGRLTLKPVATDIVPLLQELVSGFAPAAESRGLDLGFDGPERAIVSVDPAALERIVTNLVSNALKFTPSGGSIDVSLTEHEDALEIAVRDTGIGIDDEFKKRIFGRFEQGPAAVHAGTHGSGVGLSLVKELTEAQGGIVAVNSQIGRGSTFTVRLPRSAALSRSIALAESRGREGQSGTATIAETSLRVEARDFGLGVQPADAREVLEASGTAAATVLVAEDDPELRTQIAALLNREFRVILAPDGLSALRLARKHLPDLLVSDVGMPGMDGIELTRQFRQLHGNRIAPVVLLTAYGNLGDRLKGLEAGAVDYVLKPFEPAELLARIHSQLDLRQLALKLHESEKLAALGVLSSGLAHELRNPANGIVNAMGPLRELVPPELLDRESPSGELLRVIDDCSRQIAVVSRQLLGLRSSGELVRTDEPFSQILQRALALVAPAMQKVTLRNECEYIGPVHCAGALVTQIIQNLIENGAHAAGPGGWVRITSRLEEGTFVFESTDSGPGVSPANRERIFEPFFTTKAPGAGTGLGLTTARDLARKHGGDLLLRDGEDGHTVFRLEIPTAAANGATRSA